jgi:predicted O-methyltransferase YrrM
MQKKSKAIQAYCEAHTTPQSLILYALERETHLKTLAPQMMSGHLQGQFLRFLSLIAQPQYILEIGTFTGYGTLCMAAGLALNGQLHTIEANPERESIIRKYLELAQLENAVQLHIGQAEKIIPNLPLVFDMALIDGGKQDYACHYDLVMEKLKIGGLILVDNVLWDGKVVEDKTDKDTSTIQAFNQKVQEDERVENLLLPLRDGLMIIRKIR